MIQDSVSMVYITTSSLEEAHAISKSLVERGIAACANILQPIKSIYKWEGKLNTSEEYPVILKTATANVKKITEEIMKLHSYDCPCIVSWPITGGNEQFLRWVSESSS